MRGLRSLVIVAAGLSAAVVVRATTAWAYTAGAGDRREPPASGEPTST